MSWIFFLRSFGVIEERGVGCWGGMSGRFCAAAVTSFVIVFGVCLLPILFEWLADGLVM